MSRLRKQLQQIARNTNINLKNDANMTTKDFYQKTIRKLENTLYETAEICEENILTFVITTSRDPSSFLITFTKHLANLVNIKYKTRGKDTLKDLSSTNVIIIGEVKGKINNLVFSCQNSESFYFNISNMKLNRANSRFGKIDLVTHSLNIQEEEGFDISNKKLVALDLFNKTISRMFPKYEETGRKKNLKGKKEKTRKIGFLKSDNSDLISFFSYENNEFFTSFDMKMYKCVKGDIEFEGEEVWKAREFLNSL